MGKSQRIKGRAWEQEVARSLRGIDPSAQRLLEYQQGYGYDIRLKELPLRVQCKSGHLPPWRKALDEASAAASGAGAIPVAAIKVSHRGEYAVLHWQDFVEVLAAWWQAVKK
jgi:hypothetical protein